MMKKEDQSPDDDSDSQTRQQEDQHLYPRPYRMPTCGYVFQVRQRQRLFDCFRGSGGHCVISFAYRSALLATCHLLFLRSSLCFSLFCQLVFTPKGAYLCALFLVLHISSLPRTFNPFQCCQPARLFTSLRAISHFSLCSFLRFLATIVHAFLCSSHSFPLVSVLL